MRASRSKRDIKFKLFNKLGKGKAKFMSDEYTEVETVGWSSRIGNSCLGLIIGIILFFSSFFLLYWNEGRVDFSQVAKTAVEISATSPNSSAIGQLVSTSGVITSDELIGDNLFLNPGKYIVVQRKVEMYAWREEKRTETKKNVGGSETKTTTYKYNKTWAENPEKSSSFKYSQTHYNPEKAIANFTNKVLQAKVGVYNLDMSNIEIPTPNQVKLNDQNTKLTNNITLGEDYLYKGTGSLQNPQVGDLRLQYRVLPISTNVTVFGMLDSNNRITAYIHENNERLYRVFSGSRQEAISTLKTEYTILTWIMRLVGFMMMWMGLSIGLEPISVVLDFLPFLGSISRGVSVTSAFLFALVMSIVTILISQLLHNVIALMLAIAVALIATIFLRKVRN